MNLYLQMYSNKGQHASFLLPRTSKFFQVSQKSRMHDCALKPISLDDAVENISMEVKNTACAGSKLLKVKFSFLQNYSTLLVFPALT